MRQLLNLICWIALIVLFNQIFIINVESIRWTDTLKVDRSGITSDLSSSFFSSDPSTIRWDLSHKTKPHTNLTQIINGTNFNSCDPRAVVCDWEVVLFVVGGVIALFSLFGIGFLIYLKMKTRPQGPPHYQIINSSSFTL